MSESQGKSGVAMGVGAVVAGLLASVCCLGPALLAAVGLGALGAGAALEAYRPYLLGATFILLGAGFYVAYRKREVHCADGSCRMEGAGRGAKAALWSISALALGAAFYSPLKTAASRVCCAPAGTAVVAGVADEAGVPLTVTGMTCQDCANHVRRALEKVPGVKRADVSLKDGRAVVSGSLGAGDVPRLIAAVKAVGYGAASPARRERRAGPPD